MWQHRNQILHNQELSKVDHQLHINIKAEFSIGSKGLGSAVVSLFKPGLQKILQAPLFTKEAWLARVKGARQKEEKKQTHRRDFYSMERMSL